MSSGCSVPGPEGTTARRCFFCYSDIVGTPFELSRIMQEPGSLTTMWSSIGHISCSPHRSVQTE